MHQLEPGGRAPGQGAPRSRRRVRHQQRERLLISAAVRDDRGVELGDRVQDSWVEWLTDLVGQPQLPVRVDLGVEPDRHARGPPKRRRPGRVDAGHDLVQPGKVRDREDRVVHLEEPPAHGSCEKSRSR
jgi:hypothetical protein